jgi:hypothetical protein
MFVVLRVQAELIGVEKAVITLAVVRAATALVANRAAAFLAPMHVSAS